MGRTVGKLTLKEQTFINNFFGKCRGNASRAAFEAGYGSTIKSASVLSARLLGKVSVQKAIEKRLAARENESIMDADERDAVLSAIARSERKVMARIRAISELNKCTGRHSMKHLHSGKITLEQAMEASRRV